jgi:hypothetical protein
MDERRVIVLKVADSFLNHPTPYRWGGNDPLGIDCSGGVIYCYQSAGILKQKTDYTADSLYKFFKKKLSTSGVTYVRKASPEPGDCVFWFDKAGHEVEHVEIALNSQFVIGASGSGSPRFKIEDWIGVPAIATFYDDLSADQRETFVRLLNGILSKDQAEHDDAFWSIKPITYRGYKFDFLDPFLI